MDLKVGIYRGIGKRAGKRPEISRREAETRLGSQAGRQRGRTEVRRGSVTLTRAKLRNLGGYKSGYYRAMR